MEDTHHVMHNGFEIEVDKEQYGYAYWIPGLEISCGWFDTVNEAVADAREAVETYPAGPNAHN